MISGAIQILEQRNFQSSEAEVRKRDWVFDNEGDFASLYLTDNLEVWAKSIHGSTSTCGFEIIDEPETNLLPARDRPLSVERAAKGSLDRPQLGRKRLRPDLRRLCSPRQFAQPSGHPRL